MIDFTSFASATQIGEYGKETIGSGEFRRFHGSSILGLSFSDFSGVFQPNSCFFPVKNGRK
jgi:hypothetical protein